MPYELTVVFSFSIGIAAVIGGIRFKNTDSAYHPFVIYTWVAFVNEVVSYLVSMRGGQTTLNNNVFVLVEGMLLLWQAKRWKLFMNLKWLYIVLQLSVPVVWLWTAVAENGLWRILSEYRIYTGILMLLIFIPFNSRLLFEFFKPVVRNPAFILSLGVLLFFTFKVLMEFFYQAGIDGTEAYLQGVFTVHIFVNLFVNLLYITGVLWMPTKPRFISFS